MKFNFVALLSGLKVKALVGLAGWQAWLVNLIMNRAWKFIVKQFKKLMVILAVRKKVIKEELPKYQDAIKKEGATADEIKDAGKGFLED